MKEKKYIAYAIYDVELGCGCSDCKYIHEYDSSGNNYKQFDSYDEAMEAAMALMRKHNCDRWNVI